MGGGKSYILRWSLIGLLLYWYSEMNLRNVTVGLFCEDYPSLNDRHISKIEFEFPQWLGTLNKSSHEFILKPEYGGGKIAMRNLDEPSKYASAEFAAIAVDELTKNQLETFNFLRTRLRWPGIAHPKFLGGTNPGSVGHVWVKKMWMDHQFDPNEQEADKFAYLKALAADNPHLDESYHTTLESLPEKMRRAFKEGDWDIFAGQYFTEWRREYNTCAPFEIPIYWNIFLGIDYGYAKPASAHWYALDTHGRVFAYRELYGTGMTYDAFARKIQQMTPKAEQERLTGNIVADPAIFQKQGYSKEGKEKEIAKSGATEMMEATNGWLVPIRGNNDRLNGWGVMRQYMKPIKIGETITSKLIFFTTCQNAITTIPALVHDETKVEDVDTDGEDHAGDECRYTLMEIMERFSEKPKEKDNRRTAQSIFERDMRKIREDKFERDNNVDWMNI
jgi:hypothetical protein